MSQAPQLQWLPDLPEWRARLAALRAAPSWDAAAALARHRLDFIRTNALDEVVRRHGLQPPAGQGGRAVRLAILGASTLAHLHAGIRVGCLRRDIAVSIYENDYGQYLQELLDPGSALHQFKPTAVLFALDAHHLTAGARADMGAAEAEALLAETLGRITRCWTLARESFGCPVLQQTPLPLLPGLLGSNEHRLPGSAAGLLARIAAALPGLADTHKVELVDIAARAARDGLAVWHDPGMWHRAKQEVALPAAPVHGDLVARLLAALQGRSAKCLVLDLDNTLWGGVVGDDGMDGLVLGQGSAQGEAFAAVQAYAKELARRGVILAVCSKNDEANALEPFEKHPEMVLRRGDIAAFVANWSDKATNIRAIAAELNIGLDSLVFLDDNPFERNLVRQELPMVAVPEVPDDPTPIPMILADAGYFEAVAVTEEDLTRTELYQTNRAREQLRGTATDLESYLRAMEMELRWQKVDQVGLARTVQLINKTNQFNLTTRRTTEAEMAARMADPASLCLQLRLLDRFGDNGIIGILVAAMAPGTADMLVDIWLMSCRVLGRQVEPTTLNLLAEQARALGAARLVGEYLPRKKNGMVRDHYPKLGFDTVAREADGTGRFVLDLATFVPTPTFITVRQG